MSPGPAYTETESNGVYEVTDTTYGDRVDIDTFSLARDTNDSTSYVLSMHLTATKIPSSMDADNPEWDPDGFMFELVASNQHPYPFGFAQCAQQPEFFGTSLYDGESASGWVCSEDISAQYATGAYTLTWESASDSQVSVANITISAPAS